MDGSAVRRLGWGGFWLGFALGGFFDGIVLHQLLQWHHLLSGWAPGQTVGDLRFQVVADGFFHVAHYGFALLGLWLLWTVRGAEGGDRRLTAMALLGFGAWHIVDAVLVHWVLQMHRIRMDTDMPLLWDIAWLVPFGLVPAAVGAWLLGREAGPGGGRAALAGLVLLAGAGAALPAEGPGDGLALVVFRPGLGLEGIVAAVDAVEGRLVSETGGVWVVAVEGSPVRLYRHGALMVGGGWLPAGCLGWTKV